MKRFIEETIGVADFNDLTSVHNRHIIRQFAGSGYIVCKSG